MNSSDNMLMGTKRLEIMLPGRKDLKPSGRTDPAEYYRHPIVGWLYRARINMGLSLMEYPVDSILEAGCAGGLLAPTLKSVAKRYVGIDLAPPAAAWACPDGSGGMTFAGMDVSEMSFESDSFDAVVAFSLLEHLPALGKTAGEIFRVLKPGGQFICGFPLTGPFMNACFHLLGLHDTPDDHINGPARIMSVLEARFRIKKVKTMPSFLGCRTALYTCVKCEKPGALS